MKKIKHMNDEMRTTNITLLEVLRPQVTSRPDSSPAMPVLHVLISEWHTCAHLRPRGIMNARHDAMIGQNVTMNSLYYTMEARFSILPSLYWPYNDTMILFFFFFYFIRFSDRVEHYNDFPVPYHERTILYTTFALLQWISFALN